MIVRARRFTNLCLTFFVALICLDEISLANALDKPTDLRITSVHDLTITLTWKNPLSSSNTRLQYLVRYVAIGGSSQALPSQTAKSAQLPLRAETKYNIYVKAIRSDDHQIQSAWESLQVDTSRDLVPAKPTNLHLISMTGPIAKVAWDEPQTTVTGIPDTSSLNYKFSYKRVGSSKRQLTIASLPVTVSLVGNSQYEIKVVAFKSFNPRVSGPWSDILNIKTNEFAPSKPPKNVNVVSNTVSSISVSWGTIPEEGRNGFIQGFIVFYREQGADSWSNRDVGLVYSLDLTRLSAGKTYQVRVAGYTKVGRGPSSPIQPIIVGGRFITTTKQTTTQKTTEPVTQELQTTSTETPRTVPVQVDTTATESTKEPLGTTGDVFSQEPDRRTTIPYETGSKTEPSFDQSTPAVPLASKGDKESKPGFLNKILTIGVPAVGGLLLLIILIAVFVSSRKRSRRRKRQNGEIPLETDNSGRQRNSRDAITRGAFSIRYAPPGDDSMTQGLLEPSDEPVGVRIVLHGPNGTLLREETVSEDASLLGASCPEKCKLSVDLNTSQNKLTEGLYETIGSPGGAGCKTTEKNDGGERYVTHDQMGVTRDGAPSVPTTQTSPHHCNGTVAGATQQGTIYENLKDAEHLYDTLSLEDKNGPVYENTRGFPSLPENDRGKDEGYEPIPL